MGEVRLNGGKSGKMAFQTRAGLPNQAIDCCGESSVPSTVARWYSFPEFAGYLGNVGLKMRPTPSLFWSNAIRKNRLTSKEKTYR